MFQRYIMKFLFFYSLKDAPPKQLTEKTVAFRTNAIRAKRRISSRFQQVNFPRKSIQPTQKAIFKPTQKQNVKNINLISILFFVKKQFSGTKINFASEK